jgi:hypothetical protein
VQIQIRRLRPRETLYALLISITLPFLHVQKVYSRFRIFHIYFFSQLY